MPSVQVQMPTPIPSHSQQHFVLAHRTPAQSGQTCCAPKDQAARRDVCTSLQRTVSLMDLCDLAKASCDLSGTNAKRRKTGLHLLSRSHSERRVCGENNCSSRSQRSKAPFSSKHSKRCQKCGRVKKKRLRLREKCSCGAHAHGSREEHIALLKRWARLFRKWAPAGDTSKTGKAENSVATPPPTPATSPDHDPAATAAALTLTAKTTSDTESAPFHDTEFHCRSSRMDTDLFAIPEERLMLTPCPSNALPDSYMRRLRTSHHEESMMHDWFLKTFQPHDDRWKPDCVYTRDENFSFDSELNQSDDAHSVCSGCAHSSALNSSLSIARSTTSATSSEGSGYGSMGSGSGSPPIGFQLSAILNNSGGGDSSGEPHRRSFSSGSTESMDSMDSMCTSSSFRDDGEETFTLSYQVDSDSDSADTDTDTESQFTETDNSESESEGEFYFSPPMRA